MGLIDSIALGAMNLRADISGTPAPWDDYWYNPLGTASAAGMRISADTVKNLAAVLACVGKIGRNIAMMPCKIYTDIASGGKKTVPYHPIYDLLLRRPNDHHTAFEWFQIMQGWYELRGNAYAEIVPGKRGAVDQLLPMHPDRVKVERLASGSLRYVYNDPLTSGTRNLVEEEVFHLRGWSDDGITGQSTISLAKDVFGTALAQQDYAGRFVKNDATPKTALTGTNFKNKADEEEFRASWQRSQTGANRHKTAILPAGVDIKSFSVSPKDALLLDSRKFSRIEICSIFDVPPHLIGETEKTATYASVEQFNIMFAVQCLLPRIVAWEQAIARDLIVNDRYYAKFSMASLMRGDNATRAAFYASGLSGGWLCQDDIREMEDLNPTNVDGHDTYFRLATLIPIGQLPAPQPAALSGDDPPVDEDVDQTDTADPSVDESAGDGEQQAEKEMRFKAFAISGAQRCIRKEFSAVRKLLDKGASAIELRDFYIEHAVFIASVLHVKPAAAKGYIKEHLDLLSMADNPLAALRDIEQDAVTRLTEVAVNGATIQ